MLYNQAITLQNRKKTCRIPIEKGEKQDFGIVKSYPIINLLNYVSKLVEKVVAKELSQFYEDNSKLYPRQMGGWEERLVIDAVIIFVHTVQEN